jgi:ABC-type uncharacterized transport system permease subunit
MHPFFIDWEPSRRHLRTFAWSIALAIGLVAWWFADTNAGLVLRVIAAAVFALGTVRPRLFRFPFVLLAACLCGLAWAIRATTFGPAPAPRQDDPV